MRTVAVVVLDVRPTSHRIRGARGGTVALGGHCCIEPHRPT